MVTTFTFSLYLIIHCPAIFFIVTMMPSRYGENRTNDDQRRQANRKERRLDSHWVENKKKLKEAASESEREREGIVSIVMCH